MLTDTALLQHWIEPVLHWDVAARKTNERTAKSLATILAMRTDQEVGSQTHSLLAHQHLSGRLAFMHSLPSFK